MTPEAFRASLARLKLSQLGAADVLGVDGRTVRRWAAGDVGIPNAVRILLILFEREPSLMEIAREALNVSAASGKA